MASYNLHKDLFVQSTSGNQLKCSVCDCWLPSGAEKFISSHINGRKHKQQVEKRRERERILQCSVFVKGFNPLLTNLEDELEHYFEAMSIEVTDVYIDKNSASYAIVEFSESADVDKVLSCERTLFHEKKLVVKRREVPKKNLPIPVPSETKTDETSSNNGCCLLPKEVQETLNEKTDITDQMKLLMDFFRLTDEELELRNLICQLLENVLEELYPECKVMLFGSSANGLGERGCDVDLTLIANDASDTNEFYSEIREVIQRFAPGCKNVNVVQSTKTCSVVKFFHTESNLFVDLSLNNHLALNNTQLLQSYINYDERVPLVIFAVRKWSKCFGFSGHNGCQITQYSLTLLVIYYLQQVQPPVLPCFQECNKSEEKKIGQWDCSFCRCEKVGDSENKSTADDLLFGFFKFYSLFDFSQHIIAVHSNAVLTRDSVFSRVNSLLLGDAEKDLKFSSPLVVQDPFKRTHNVTHNLSCDGLLLLTSALKHVCTLYDNHSPAEISLIQLFTEKNKARSREKQKQKRNRSNMYSISLPNCQHSCEKSETVCFDYIRNILENDLRMRICNENEEEVSENKTVSELVNVNDNSKSKAPVLLDILKRNCDELEVEDIGSKRIKLSSVRCLNYVATAYADTWTNRRKQRRLLQKLQQSDKIDVDISHDTNEDADSGVIMSDISIPNSDSSSLITESVTHALLHFNVGITKASNENEVCKLKLESLDNSKNIQDFQTFYAYIKKELIAVFK